MGCLSRAWYYCPKQAFTFLVIVNLYYNCTVYFYFIEEADGAQRG